MEAKNSKKDRRRRYCSGITSEYYIATGVPMQEARDREVRKTEILRAQILKEESINTDNNINEDEYSIIFD